MSLRKLAKELIERMPVTADERGEKVEGVVVSEQACDRRSQWFSNSETPDDTSCSIKSRPAKPMGINAWPTRFTCS
jgi:hypothetical protein